ncbi:MAG: cobalamin-binding protein [Planctomycetota bacterium]|nr:MAG: cobalamin-binding protein [Planctomycetota bacterium]
MPRAPDPPPAHPRVASLLPSATEIVCALGMRSALVGVSHECDFPPGVDRLPILTSTRVLAEGRSGPIDRDVRRLLAEALAVYDIDTATLARVRPDVIVTQDLCDVCAVSLQDVERAVRELAGPAVRIVSLHPTKLAEVWDGVREVAQALGCEAEAELVLAALRERIDAVVRRVAGAGERPNVLTIEWLDPVMVGGTWMPELIALAGGRALVTQPGQHAPTLSEEELRDLDPAPDVVLVKPCGFTLERTLAESDALRELLGRLDWPAVRAGRVYLADGNSYFNRPGPRLVESLEILAACVHPGLCSGWVRGYTPDCVRPFGVESHRDPR